MTDYQTKGIENRKKRARKVWQKMAALYNRPANPLTVAEIVRVVKKKNGKPYSRSYFYEAMAKLRGEI
jgi:hypothetical protein